MGWLDDLTSPDIFGESTPEVGSSGWDIFGQSSPEVGSAEWLTQELSNLPATDTSGITGTIGDDWSLPVTSETGDYFTDADIFGGDWAQDIFPSDWSGVGGDDWSIPVLSETGATFGPDASFGGDWIGDWFSSLSAPEVGSAEWLTQELAGLEGSETGDYYTDADIFGTSFMEDFLGGDYENLVENWPATYGADPVTGYSDEITDEQRQELIDKILYGGGSDDEDPETELTWWQKLLQGVIGSGSGPFGGSVLGPQEGTTQGLLGGILSTLFGGGGGGGVFGGAGGAGGEGAGGGIGGLFGSNPLMSFLMMKSLMKDDKSPAGMVPVGQQAYGAPEAYNMPDYRVTNLQPALMPGVGYANMAQPQPQPQQPTAMRQGGLAGLMEPMPPRGDPDRRTPPTPTARQMQQQAFLSGGGGRGWKEGGLTSLSEGPGDITLAKLEPGEFVITREAVDKVGLPALERINNMGRGRSA